jgi:hypothetical protein
VSLGRQEGKKEEEKEREKEKEEEEEKEKAYTIGNEASVGIQKKPTTHMHHTHMFCHRHMFSQTPAVNKAGMPHQI